MENSNKIILIEFEPAQLFKGSIWYVQYKVVDPSTNKLIIKRNKINRIKCLKERERYGKRLVKEINQKLYSGWNPIKEKEAPRAFTYLKDAMNTFLRVKSKELRPASMRSYESHVKIINDWLDINKIKDCYCVNFKKNSALKILNDIYIDKGIGNTTYNNHLMFFNVLFNWLEEQQYVGDNPFKGISKKKVNKKVRTIVSNEDRDRIKSYLKNKDYNFYIISLLVYHALIRPKEITFLKPEYFNYENQTIFIPSEAAKNRNARTITIPDVLLKELVKFNFNGAKKGEYIFGKYWRPNTEQINSRQFGKKWDRLRKALKLDANIQFYSLRDTGIVQMFRDGISADEIMKQADHSSLIITTKYAKHYDVNGSDVIKKNVSCF